MLQTKKQKEMQIMYNAMNLTNWALLLHKGVFTIEEWSTANMKLANFLQEKEAEGKGKDYESLLTELNDFFNSEDFVKDIETLE